LILKDRENLRALIYYALLIAVFYSPVLFAGKSLVPSLYQNASIAGTSAYGADEKVPVNSFNVDIATPAYFESPINALVGEQVRGGSVPLWNPYQAAGTPLLAQYSTRALFPLQILEDISPVWSWDFFMLFRLLVAGFFTFLFLRSISLAFVPAFLGGLFYIFSGTFVWFINLEQMVNVAMMLPVVFFALERLARRGGATEISLTGLAFALTLLAGQPEVALYVICAASLYYFLRLFYYKRRRGRGVSRGLFDICVASVFALALSAPLLLPFIELWANAHHIHHIGGAMGTQALPAWNRILPILTPTVTEMVQDPSMVKGLCPLVSATGMNFFRFLPINGVWDSLGGYTGVLPWLLAIAGLIAGLGNSKSPWRGPLYFFFAVAIAIILKNIGLRPFIWLGSVPLFDQVWSLRWAGPVWTFALSAAGAIGLQMILPQKAYGSLDDDPRLMDASGGSLMAPNPFRRKIDQYLRRNPHMPVLISFLLLLFFYTYAALAATVTLVLRSGEIFNSRMEPFVGPSIGGALIVFFVVLFLFLFIGAGVSRSLKGRGYAAFVMLAAVELWWAVPRGYAPEALINKWWPFALGLLIVFSFYKRARVLSVILCLVFFAATLYLDINSSNAMPERSDPFEATRYVEFIKKQEGHFRVAGSYGVLMPNFASSVGLLDVHYVNSLIPSAFHNFRTNYLHADPIIEEPVSSLWFTGRPERCAVTEEASAKGGYLHHYRRVEDDFLTALKGYSLLGVKYFITPPDLTFGRVFPLIYDSEVRIYRNPMVLDRAWVVRDVSGANDAPEAQAQVFEQDFYPSVSAVVEDFSSVERFKDIQAGRSINERVEITEYAPARVVIEAELKAAGLLILSDTFYPGWEVSVNNVAAEPLRVDGVLRGVELKKGKSIVVWSYRPMSFKIGVMLCLGSIIICLAFILCFRRKVKIDSKEVEG
jgi:hypothetical protein